MSGKPAKKEEVKNKIVRFFIGIGVLCFLGGLIGIITITYFSFALPKISTLADYRPPIHSQILAKDGTILADIGIEKREIARFDEIPQVVIDAFLSAEDAGFYEHKGVDYPGVLRALIANLKAGKVVQGGSTITQQVAKSLLLTRERSYSRKIKDFLLAQKIEKKFSKKEILFLYLNQVYLGGGYYGVKAAFRGYFGKELDEVTIAESAMIAGLLVAPGKYSPYVNPAYAKKRQSYVLRRMYSNGKISQEEYKAAADEKIQYRLRKKNEFKAGYFTDWVRQRVIELVGEEKFLKDGFKVYTTLDWELQQVAEKQVWEGVKAIDRRQGYKGPLSHLETPEDIKEYEIEFRKKLLREKSQYFVLDDNNEKEYELEFDEEALSFIDEHREAFRKEVRNRRFIAGNSSEDAFLNLLEVGKSYKAIVTKLDDWARLIYVSIGGVVGIIPYTKYNWAHERVIDEKKNIFPRIIRPSTFLKVGDEILVELNRMSTSVWRQADKNFTTKFKEKKFYGEVAAQRYLLCALDQAPDAQGALFSVIPQTGEIVAFVGGADFKLSQFNRALQSKRQPGSSFKPILFAAGLEGGFTPASILLDSPEALGGADEGLNWKPSNYDGKFKGPMTFRNALEQSRNVPTIKLADALGVPKIVDFVDRIGLNAKLDPDLSLALGSFGVTLLDIVATYAVFPNSGKMVQPKSIISIQDRDGNFYSLEEKFKHSSLEVSMDETLLNEEGEDGMLSLDVAEADKERDDFVKEPEEKNPYLENLDAEQVYDQRLAYLMSNLLRGVVLHGTGRRAKSVSHYLGGKTGTTNSYVDAWFIGFSSNIATGVWTGFDDNTTLGWGETGAKSALPIWKEFMRAGLKKFGEKNFSVPGGIINVLIDKQTGRPIDGMDRENSFMEAFVEGTEPGVDQTDVTTENLEETDAAGIFEEDDYFDNQ